MSDDALDKELRQIQKALSKPGEKILGTLGYYLNFLNPLAKNGKTQESEDKKTTLREQKHSDITWIDIENPSHKEINELAEKYFLHPLHLEACLLKGQLDRVEKEEKYLFILLHSPSYNTAENKIQTEQICIFLGKNYLITVHEGSELTISNLFKECQEDKDKQEAFFKKSASYLLYNVIDNIIKDISSLHKVTLQELDDIEDLVFDVKVSGAYKISQLRQKIIRLRRLISPFKSMVSDLASNQNEFVGSMSRYYKNILNEVNKLWESLDEAKETIEIYKDADFIVSTEKTNQILSVLTIVFTLTIPATVFGTFYGMNILLPGGLEAGSWMELGPFTTFYFVLGISALAILLMLWFFKFKNWF